MLHQYHGDTSALKSKLLPAVRSTTEVDEILKDDVMVSGKLNHASLATLNRRGPIKSLQ